MWVMWLIWLHLKSPNAAGWFPKLKPNQGTNRNDLTVSHKNRENCDRKIFLCRDHFRVGSICCRCRSSQRSQNCHYSPFCCCCRRRHLVKSGDKNSFQEQLMLEEEENGSFTSIAMLFSLLHLHPTSFGALWCWLWLLKLKQKQWFRQQTLLTSA